MWEVTKIVYRIGKFLPQDLERLILPFRGRERKEVLFGAHIGRDSGVLSLSGNYLALTCDPVTGATRGAGLLAPHLVANDLICSGAEPVALLVSLILPQSVEPSFARSLMEDIDEASRKIGFAILGGHTEVSDAVRRPIIHCTGVGKITGSTIPDVTKVAPGDAIVITKGAGIEGTGILALEWEKELSRILPEEEVQRAQGFLDRVSVLEEGRIALSFSPHCLHDATEGGVLGAIFEVCRARGLGFEVERSKIPIFPETQRISAFFDIDPLRLVSSGTLLIFAPDPKPLLEALEAAGIPASCIGRVSEERCFLIHEDGFQEEISECPQDELWRVLEGWPK